MLEPELDLGAVGTWTSPLDITAEPAEAAAYARATDDPNSSYAHGVTPPLFVVALVVRPMQLCIDALANTAAQATIVHARHDVHFHRPVRAGDTVRVSASAIGVEQRRSGVLAVIRVRTSDGTGAPINDQYASLLFRGLDRYDRAGESAPALVGVEPEGPVTVHERPTTADQALRYADASGDRNRIHLDAEFARSVGLRGVILQGLCTLAMASRAVTEDLCDGAPTALTRLAARFSAAVIPGDTLEVQVQRAAGSRHAAFGVQVKGAAVITERRAVRT